MVSTNIKNNIAQWLSSAALAFVVVFALAGVTACSENEDSTEEFANWKSVNDAYYNNLYKQSVIDSVSDKSIKIIRSWSLTELSTKPEDFIIVKKIKASNSNIKPLYTDSVEYHFQGKLLPSATYPNGKIFQQSWVGKTLDTSISTPYRTYVKKRIDGLITALQNMNVGERWQVYVPYQLGYQVGSAELGIPQYSVLIYDISLSKIIRE
ncbi:MAG: FKBP-type peptidyl-prolyl cis-trans isomerase [Prevotellaceae bacterium]|nr:FKBP-type peptidyl-prolyl cis-trans isomerase [Prevotella sp.]MDD7273758.1 FKBP-type peptidyl-prolyl cis-trans isomerase [Prevotellaceae bacterium]MDY4217499.1 FKBP-type peptidyl-prolyl cis-trans isomerase [Prevotella sp.]